MATTRLDEARELIAIRIVDLNYVCDESLTKVH